MLLDWTLAGTLAAPVNGMLNADCFNQLPLIGLLAGLLDESAHVSLAESLAETLSATMAEISSSHYLVISSSRHLVIDT